MPWFLSSISSCANTTAQWACTAPFVIQYFCASVVGLWMMKVPVRGSL